MRFVMMLLGLGMIALAALWFFTPVLDSTYARIAPGIAQSRTTVTAATRAAQPSTATRSAAPGSSAPGIAQSSGASIGSKALAENVMSMINLGSGLLGAWFTYMSYRLQARRRD